MTTKVKKVEPIEGEIRTQPLVTDRVELDEDGGAYKGWYFEAWMQPPLAVFTMMASGEMDQIAEALSIVIQKWNYVDIKGAPIEPTVYDITRKVNNDLLGKTASAWVEKLSTVPPS